MEVDGILKDLSHEITKDSKVRIITSKNKEGLEVDEDGDLVDGFSPFLDDSGNPVPVPKKAEDSTEEAEEEVAEEAENAPKKRGRPKKTEEVS